MEQNQIYYKNTTMVISIENGILTNDNTLRTDPFTLISSWTAEEADRKLVRHMLQGLLTGIKIVVVKTVDTDVFCCFWPTVIQGEVFFKRVSIVGTGKLNSCFYSINDIALDLGEEVCQALLLFHACTGCNTVSSFFNHGKWKFWDRWFYFENESLLINVFNELSQRPTNITVELLILKNICCRFIIPIWLAYHI